MPEKVVTRKCQLGSEKIKLPNKGNRYVSQYRKPCAAFGTTEHRNKGLLELLIVIITKFIGRINSSKLESKALVWQGREHD